MEHIKEHTASPPEPSPAEH